MIDYCFFFVGSMTVDILFYDPCIDFPCVLNVI